MMIPNATITPPSRLAMPHRFPLVTEPLLPACLPCPYSVLIQDAKSGRVRLIHTLREEVPLKCYAGVTGNLGAC